MNKLNQIRSKVVFYGGTGQSKVLRPIVENLGSIVSLVIDDTPDLVSPFDDVLLVQGMEGFKKWFKGRNSNEYTFIAAIGNPHGRVRSRLSAEFEAMGFDISSVAHKSVIFESNVKIGKACQLMPASVLCSDVCLEDCVIVNTGASIDHESVLCSGSEVGPGGVLCGNVRMEVGSWVGARAVILPRINIGQDAIVGAGAVVTKDVGANDCVIGVPARSMGKE